MEWQKKTTTGLGAVNQITFKNSSRAFASILGNGEGRQELFKSLVSSPDRQFFFPTSPINEALTGFNLSDCTDVIFLSKYDTIYSDKYYEFITGSGQDTYDCVLTINYPELLVARSQNYDIIGQALRYPIIFDITVWLSNYDFEQVSQKRMVRSVVLGGDFFVEKMAYNVNKGNAVLEERAKDMAVLYGLNSKQYADAIRAMNERWLHSKRSWLLKLVNYLMKRQWQKKHSNR